ncbi:hypothetical protein CAL65_13125 [Alkalilimnicola ehrlichii]|uniref:Uncharacterized protein n=1 Tax=Alkalilimnicola ehrlichii TaxID=351052 RepID=A0A3E0WTU8_9GAMM|nr:hypothetical protein CAL65_13125 [Alkalilimnicola ehrlichii]
MANGFGSAGPLRAGAAIGGGKKAHGAANLGEVKALQREYRRLKRALGDIVPRTLFVHTDVDGRPGVIALAEVAQPWFDLANPGNEEESLHLLQLWPDAGHQFTFFVRAATAWAAQDMMIDLTGDSNLVLDRSRAVRFIDSFRVFFTPTCSTARMPPIPRWSSGSTYAGAAWLTCNGSPSASAKSFNGNLIIGFLPGA